MVHTTSIISLLAVSAYTAFAANDPNTNTPRVVPGAYIVEFDEKADAGQFRIQAEPEYETRVNLNFDLFKGVSIQLKDIESAEDRAAQLASLPSVKNIWPVTVVDRPEPVVIENVDATSGTSKEQEPRLRKRYEALSKREGNGTAKAKQSIIMQQMDKLHAKGITGKGTVIAIIDTGVDYNNPALGGCFGKGCLVAKGYDFVGDDYDGFGTRPVPDNDPDDCMGHGSHVAGIIAAQENPYFVSAAPGVTLAAYRVFGCGGTATDDIFIAAFNKAFEDGADIITASVGAPSGFSSAPWALVVSRIVEKGVPCTIAAGNRGRGLFDGSNPADGKGVESIASFDNMEIPSFLIEGNYTSSDSNTTETFLWKAGVPSNFDGVKRKLWVTGYNVTNDQDGCMPLPDDTPDLSEYNILIRRARRCGFFVQMANFAAKGARFVIWYNNQPGVTLVDVGDIGNVTGVAMVPKDLGEAWIKQLESGAVAKTQMTHDDTAKIDYVLLKNELSGGGVSTYTSWGPTFSMDFKPQFGAVGGFIMSTLPLEKGGYGGMSGTSMATPYVAAAYALMAEARGKKMTPALFESLLSSTAKAQRFQWEGPFEDWLAPPAQQGAGIIQVFDAAYATSHFEPASLSFNDTDHFVGTMNFTIINNGSGEVTYGITHVPTHSLYTLREDGIRAYFANPAFSSPLSEHAELKFSTVKVTVQPGSSTAISVIATPPQGLEKKRMPFWSGYIVANGTDGSSLSLPYQGLEGSLYEASGKQDPDGIFYLVDSNTNDPVVPNTTFTLPTPDATTFPNTPFPYTSQNMHWGSSQVMVDLVPLNATISNSTGMPNAGTIGQLAGYPAIDQPRFLSEYGWYGQLADGQYAPAGQYKMVFQALRLFGDVSEQEDWVTAETVPFTVEYAK